MADNQFTLDKIKKAFWDTFNSSGELWFGEERDTELEWDNFLENLQKGGE